MAVSREKKVSLGEGYGKELAEAPHAFVLGFRGIKVGQVTELRRRIREKGGHYVVIKNTVARRVIQGKPLEQLQDHLVGPTAIAYSLVDPVALAKVLTEFAKETPVIEFKAGLVEGRPIAANQVSDIATMPSREELIAKILFLVKSPISRFVRVLAAAGPQRLALVLDQVAKQKS
jgi:large subunit ribosomal protein L10